MPEPTPKAIKVTTLERPYKVTLMRADPDFEARKRKEPFYEFSGAGKEGQGRNFTGDTSHQGPYSTKPNIR